MKPTSRGAPAEASALDSEITILVRKIAHAEEELNSVENADQYDRGRAAHLQTTLVRLYRHLANAHRDRADMLQKSVDRLIGVYGSPDRTTKETRP